MAKTVAKKEKKEPTIGRYKLLPDAGPHFESNVDFDETLDETEDNVKDFQYDAGDIVESPRPLDKIFVNKFRKVSDDEEPSKGPQAGGQVARDPENDPNKDRPVRTTEDATRATSDRFLDEEELEGKPEELKKLARGEGAKKKSVLEDDEDEDDEEVANEVDDDEEDEEVEEEKTTKRPSRSIRASKIRKANK